MFEILYYFCTIEISSKFVTMCPFVQKVRYALKTLDAFLEHLKTGRAVCSIKVLLMSTL